MTSSVGAVRSDHSSTSGSGSAGEGRQWSGVGHSAENQGENTKKNGKSHKGQRQADMAAVKDMERKAKAERSGRAW